MAKITTEEFIRKAKEVHGDKYDYSKTVYNGALEKVIITCKKHGDFKQLPSNHLKGSGCKICSIDSMKRTTRWFIERAKKIHGNRYDYSKSKYINGHTKICIICSKHGEFWQIPNDHLYGHGCHKCSNDSNGKTRIKGLDFYVSKAKIIHGDKYDYSKVQYVNSKTKTCIICHEKDANGNEHGEFWQSMLLHAKGNGCPKCSGLTLKTTDEFIKQSKIVHGDKYDYSKVNYVGSHIKVCIVCPIHGEFWQTPNAHLNEGSGCVHCKGYDTKQFIEKAKEMHGSKYDYSKVNYKNSFEKVCIICPQHGEFWQRANTHLSGRGCPSCGQVLSKGENELYAYYVRQLGIDNVCKKDRKTLNGKEIDIFFPNHNFGIEFDGLLWHSEKYRNDKFYHLNKTIACKKKGITLMHVFEDEWKNKSEIVIDIINHFLGLNSSNKKISARKCVITEGSFESSRGILNENHIEGETESTVYLNCLYNNKIVGAMLFTLKGENKWELVRWVTNNNFILQGLASKTFNYFLKNYKPNEITSFLDRKYHLSDKNLYTILGFKFEGYIEPNYKYTKNGCSRIDKSSFKEISCEKIEELGYYKIWDCGLLKYIWRKDERH